MNKRPKILIVDDKPENLVALRVVLKDLEIELVEASSGNEALKATLHHNFALALLDIQMPEMDGYELAGILREEEKTMHLPFIFISAVYTDNLNVFKGYERGAFSFITKPFQPEILINKVKFFIEKYQQEIALFELNNDLVNKNNELIHTNQELEAFSYSISHDLRAPLRSIKGYASILYENYGEKLDDEANRMLNTIIFSVDKMGELIDSLLNLSRFGKQEVKETVIDMNALTKTVLANLASGSDNPNLQVQIQDLPSATGDIKLLEQVLINLISNAKKYSAKKEHPLIEIGSQSDEKHGTVYYVKDNGAGFDMSYKDKLFGVFQRLHHETEFEGIGIGLALVQRIVRRHNGTVWAEGEVGKGATFYFSFSGQLPVGQTG